MRRLTARREIVSRRPNGVTLYRIVARTKAYTADDGQALDRAILTGVRRCVVWRAELK